MISNVLEYNFAYIFYTIFIHSSCNTVKMVDHTLSRNQKTRFFKYDFLSMYAFNIWSWHTNHIYSVLIVIYRYIYLYQGQHAQNFNCYDICDNQLGHLNPHPFPEEGKTGATKATLFVYIYIYLSIYVYIYLYIFHMYIYFYIYVFVYVCISLFWQTCIVFQKEFRRTGKVDPDLMDDMPPPASHRNVCWFHLVNLVVRMAIEWFLL